MLAGAFLIIASGFTAAVLRARDGTPKEVCLKDHEAPEILRWPSQDCMFRSLLRVTGGCSTHLSGLQVSAPGASGRCLEHGIWSFRGSAAMWGSGCLSLGVPVEACRPEFKASVAGACWGCKYGRMWLWLQAQEFCSAVEFQWRMRMPP